MNKSIKIILTATLCLPLLGVQGICAATWGETPDIRVEGNHLVNTRGEQVMLHGIMDTPSPYFSGYRFTDGQWIDVYRDGDNYITKCIDYFDKLFTAATDTEQGAWCNVLRLHLDPCWTDNPNVSASGFVNLGNNNYKDPNGNEVNGEACIRNFDKTRLQKYLGNLYIPIAKKAKAHNMYVIMRPPGVCPKTIKVGDYYQQYLITVWDIVTQNQDVLNNSGWLSIELANEPIEIRDASGNATNTAMRDYFQPIVDKIRANGFKGIIWIPGGSWQQDYKSYAKYPVTDTQNNFGYAVHWYPGWYSTSDKVGESDNAKSLSSFLANVPVAKTHPIMITEIDWSPEDPSKEGKYNEWGEWVHGNYGTWGTGSTSKFGMAYKYVIDYLGNCGMTLTHTHDYMDIDYYLSTGVLRPAFSTELANNAWEACSGACFKWYSEYAQQTHVAREWEVGKYAYLDKDECTDPAANLSGKVLGATDDAKTDVIYVINEGSVPQNVKTGVVSEGEDQGFMFFKFTKVTNASTSVSGNLYNIQMANSFGQTYSLWGKNGYLNSTTGGNLLFALGLNNQNGEDGKNLGLWKVDYEAEKGYVIQNVGLMEAGKGAYLNPSYSAPQSQKCYIRLFTQLGNIASGIDAPHVEAQFGNGRTYDLSGRVVVSPTKPGIYVRNGKKFIVK